MRIEIAGAQITDAVVDVIDDLQNQNGLSKAYLETIDKVTRLILSSNIDFDDENATDTLSILRGLHMIRHSLEVISSPSDADDPANDIPTASF